EGIYPTPVLGVAGILEDVSQAAFPHFREAGRSVVLLRGSEPGDVTDAEIEFGSSEYAKSVLDELWGFPPALAVEKVAALQNAVVELIGAGRVDSADDCSDGGLGVALGKCSFGSGIGRTVELRSAWTHSTPSSGSVAQSKFSEGSGCHVNGDDAERLA